MAITNCCSDYQGNCNKVVTIGFLREFIGQDIHSSVDDSVITISSSLDDTYCPTYSELTNGSIIQCFVRGIRPSQNVDGILVDNICYGTGFDYESNQLVNIQDISIRYTRFQSFSIGVLPTELNACEPEMAMLSSVASYEVFTKSLSNNCDTTQTSHSAETDTSSSDVAWSVNGFGTIEFPYFIAGTNLDKEHPREATITGGLVYRGRTTSEDETITQRKLTGEYEHLERSYEVLSGIEALPIGSTTHSTCNSVTVSAECIGNYDIRAIYSFVDSCDNVYSGDVIDVSTGTRSQQLETDTYTFEKVLCPIDNIEEEKTISFNVSGFTDGVTFTRTCTQTCECKDYDDEPTYDDVPPIPCSGGSVTVVGRHNEYRGAYWDDGVCKYASVTEVEDRYTVTTGCNPDNSIRFIDERVYQEAGPCCCTELTMNASTSSSNPVPKSGGTVDISTYTYVGNVSNITVTSYPTTFMSNPVVNTSGKKVTATFNSRSCGETETRPISGTVIVSYSVDGENCSTSFDVFQQRNNDQCECTQYEYDASVAMTTADACGTGGTASLTVQRKCITPYEGEYETFNNGTVAWQPMTQNVNITSFERYQATFTMDMNCTSSQQTGSIKYILRDENNQEVKTDTFTVKQSGGPCSDCSCTDYEYSANCPSNVTEISNCETSGTVVGFGVNRRCVSPTTGEYEAYDNYVIVWEPAQPGSFISLNGFNYTASTNCTTSERRENRSFTAYTNTSPQIEITSCTVSFEQVSGLCSTCGCQGYSYSATCPSNISGIDGCGENGTIGGFSISAKCTNPPSEEYTPVTDYVIVWDSPSGSFINLDGFNYTASTNCTTLERSEERTFSAYTDSTRSTLMTSCTVVFTQDAGSECQACSCTDWDYRIQDCPSNITDIDVCGGAGTIGGLDVEKKCLSPVPSDWEDAYIYDDYSLSWDTNTGHFIQLTANSMSYTALANDTKQQRSEIRTLTITVANRPTSSCTVTFTQVGGICNDFCTGCTYVNLNLSSSAITVSSNSGVNTSVIASTDCENADLTASVIGDDSSWITSVTIDSGGTISVEYEENQDLNPRSATIRISVDDIDNCHKDFTITQDGRQCNCGDLKIEITE